MVRRGTPMARRACEGFSLVELMIVVAISVILLAIAAPSFRDLIQKQKITATVNDFFFAIKLARSEAIQRGTRVELVPVEAGGDWAKGWAVFVDGNDNQKPDAGEQVIYTQGPLPGGISIEARMTDSTKQYLAYQGTGRTRTNANSQTPQYGSFLFTLDEQRRKININMLGRARVCNPDVDKSTC
ncbi:MAG: GspH/FimT family pseudopilin [Noviherbaspirillum sp.]